MPLTAAGCRRRRERLGEKLATQPTPDALLLGDPLHLRYLAGFHVDPFSLAGDFGGLLLVRRDGSATLFFDSRLQGEADAAHVEERRPLPWYDGQTPGRGPRRLALQPALDNIGRIHDGLADPLGPTVISAIGELRRRKDADELDLLRSCMRAGDAGHAWGRQNLRAGLTELDVYLGISNACAKSAGQAAIVYGDFAVSPGPERRGGPPTDRVLKDGDLFILDFSVVLAGYRSDFTTTLCVGGRPTTEQRRLFDLCLAALAAGERQLRAGALCQAVFDAVDGSFAAAGVAEFFGHHAGHGLGLAHPEAPFFVKQATETLLAGDVVTLEPGLYVPGVGGMRIEHNYLVTDAGCERLSGHTIALV
jgi:Xaa-Pro dipeptidase